uniref:Uncharacterized protein n=1 Tax=Loa loa TaxID=7209 RepID=A0A1I7VKS9_LOALO
MAKTTLNEQSHDEVQLTDDNVKSATTDLQIIDATYDFCQRLKAQNLSFRKSQAEGIEDRKCVQNGLLPHPHFNILNLNTNSI